MQTIRAKLFLPVLQYLGRHRPPLVWALLLLLLSGGLLFLARNAVAFGPFYNRYLYPILPNTMGRLLSPLPFSLFEFLLCLVLLLVCLFVLYGVFSLFTAKGRARLWSSVGRRAPAVLCIVSVLFFMQTLTCFLNYSRMDFSEEIGIAVYPASAADVTALCRLLISDLNGILAEPGMEGGIDPQAFDVRQESKEAMKQLGRRYPSLKGYYPNPKPVFFSKAMSTVSLTGIFSPYTTEANYNRDVTPYLIPYTICHELAHVKGFIKENEAGFIAYLACSEAASPQLRYSAALNGLSYSLNALYQNVTPEEYRQLLATVPEQALSDLQANQAYWQQFRQGVRGVISETARSANDQYLKANAQTDGSKSYGRMVDLLLAYYKIGADPV